MSGHGMDWYSHYPRDFLDGAQGLGPELIGAYIVLLDLIYARGGATARDDRHLAGIMGCSLRKARALTDGLIERGKIEVHDGFVTNSRARREVESAQNRSEKRSKAQRKRRETSAKPARKQRETSVKQSRNEREIDARFNENNDLTPLHNSTVHNITKDSDLSDDKSAVPPGETPKPIDHRTRLFRDGLASLSRQTGKQPDKLRGLIGKHLKALNDDCRTLCDLVFTAENIRVAEPLGWLQRAVETRTGGTHGNATNGSGQNQLLSACQRLAGQSDRGAPAIIDEWGEPSYPGPLGEA